MANETGFTRSTPPIEQLKNELATVAGFLADQPTNEYWLARMEDLTARAIAAGIIAQPEPIAPPSLPAHYDPRPNYRPEMSTKGFAFNAARAAEKAAAEQRLADEYNARFEHKTDGGAA